MKRLKICFCVGVLALSMAACGKAGEDGSSQGSGQGGSSGSTQGSSGAAQDGSGAQDDTGTPDASGSGSGTEIDENRPDGTGEGWSEEMEGIKTAVVEALGDDYWPDMPMDAEIFEMFFGITPDMYEDYMAESPMISANVDTLVIVKAKEDTADAVEETLNSYRDSKVNDTMQYPQNVGKIQASQVVRIGNYVVFVQLGADTSNDSEEEAIARCQEDNELVIGIIRQHVEQ